MKKGTQVKYIEPMSDEVGVTFIIREIEEATNWCMLTVDIGWGNLNPTRVANLSDLTEAK